MKEWRVLIVLFSFALTGLNCSAQCVGRLGEGNFFSKLRNANSDEILCAYKENFDQLSDSLFEDHAKRIKLIDQSLYIRQQLAFASYLNSKDTPDKALIVLGRLKTSGEIDAEADLLISYYNIHGMIFGSVGRLKEAEIAYKKGMKIAISLKDSANMKRVFINLGDTFYQQRQYDSTEYYLDLAMDLEENGVKNFHGPLYNNLGVLYLSKGKNSEAISIYTILIEETQDNPVSELFLNLGKAYHLDQKFDQSIDVLFKGLEIEKKGRADSDMLHIFYEELSRSYKMSDSINLAFHFLGQADSIEQLHKDVKMNLAIDELRLAYQEEIYEKESLIDYHKMQREKSIKNQLAVFLSVTLLLLVIIYIFYVRQKRQSEHLLRKNLELSNIKKKKVRTRDISDEILCKIEKNLIENNAFLDPNLTLDKLSKKLKTNRSYLSETINEHYSMNFRVLINKLRIEKAQEMLADQKFQHYSIEGIATTVGFKSLSSFNSFFKKETGLTPSFYRKESTKIDKN